MRPVLAGTKPEIARSVVLFPRAVRADERHNLAGVDLKRDGLQGANCSVRNANIFKCQHQATPCAAVSLAEICFNDFRILTDLGRRPPCNNLAVV